MEGMAGQHYQCRCRHNRRRCPVAREKSLGCSVLVGRLDYHGFSGEHGLDFESIQFHSRLRG